MLDFTLPLEDALLQFTLVLLVVLVVQRVFHRVPVPGLIGLLVVGMLIGPGGAQILPAEPVVELLGSIGLLFIMFLAGLEIDLEIVRHHKRESAVFGALCLLLSFLPVLGVGLLFGLDWPGALLLAAALASHTLISYPIVQRMGLIHRRPIVAAVGGTLLTDTAALVVLVVVLQLSGAEEGALGWAGPIVLLAVLAAAALYGLPRLARATFEDPEATLAENALFVVAALLALAALAELIGTKDILGAFIAGIALNLSLKRREVLFEHLIFAGRMLFIPFFFIQTGMKLELAVFGEIWPWVMAGLLVLAVLAGKGGAAWITGRSFGFSRTGRWAMIGMTLPQAAATLAVTTTAEGAGLIDATVVDAVIVVIFITCLCGALLTRATAWRLRDHRDPHTRVPRDQ
ncbi:cation:proton antiporter [Pararhodobacter sp. SW119]|uniref:cation:proton antiporter n=1 Tax=Pararhodobacter sp. SW119 TaxID=2780075 RepID=UPI001ADFB1EC|nr:cation:proton antiporter [Pararhodobacter sp. SW119]